MTTGDIIGANAGKRWASFPSDHRPGSFDEYMWDAGRRIMIAWVSDARDAGRVDVFNISKLAELFKFSRSRYT
ncbi:MAG: hypothetical protein JRC86_07240, partial [Deltaproteobacteria bacterium]|nr:hypothetical protein [Deltaproteobacteria bacterium]